MLQQAARGKDPVTHGLGVLGLLAGAVVGALLVAGTVASGGALAMVVGAGMVAGGALTGAAIVNSLQQIMNFPGPETGVLGIGSEDVFVGGPPAARAQVDFAVACNGLFWLNHPPMAMVPIAQGSQNVFINGFPAARVGDKLVCGAEIKAGCADVYIGGGTTTVCAIQATGEELTEAVLGWVAWGALGALGAQAWAAGAIALLELASVTALSIIASQQARELGNREGGPAYGMLLGALVGGGLLVGMAVMGGGKPGGPEEPPAGPPEPYIKSAKDLSPEELAARAEVNQEPPEYQGKPKLKSVTDEDAAAQAARLNLKDTVLKDLSGLNNALPGINEQVDPNSGLPPDHMKWAQAFQDSAVGRMLDLRGLAEGLGASEEEIDQATTNLQPTIASRALKRQQELKDSDVDAWGRPRQPDKSKPAPDGQPPGDNDLPPDDPLPEDPNK